MSGVEAAASLFGSEESETDLFATLGTEPQTTPEEVSTEQFPVNELPRSNEGASSLIDVGEQVPTNGTIIAEHSTYASESYPQTTNASAPYSQTWAHYGSVHEQHGVDTSYSTAVPSTRSYVSQLPPQTPDLSPATYTGTTASYSPYGPPSQYTVDSFPSPPATNAYNMYQPSLDASPSPYSLPSTTPAPQYSGFTPSPLQSTTVTPPTRPKVSNAYDPPFIPSSSHRRRAGGVPQAFNNHQVENSSTFGPNATSFAGHTNNYPTTLYSNSQQGSLAYSSDTYSGINSNTNSGYTDSNPLNGGPHINPLPVNHQENPQPKQNDIQPFAHSKNHILSDKVKQTQGLRGDSQPYSEDPSNPTPAYARPLALVSGLASEHGNTPAANQESYVPPSDLLHHTGDGGSVNRDETITNHSQPHHNFYKPPQKEGSFAQKEGYDPYAPKLSLASNNYIPRTSSPLSIHNVRGNDSRSLSPESRKTLPHSNGSVYGSPPQPSLSASTSYGPPYLVRPPSVSIDEQLRQPQSRLDVKISAQDVVLKSSNAQYAPSPSLIGSNDPLSRTTARAPLITFGFGGKIVTCFHGMAGLNAGFDVALSSRPSSEVKVHILYKLLPDAAMNIPSSAFPGPLVSDSGLPALSIVRPGSSAQTKSKKSGVLTYLSGRAEEIRQGIPYLSNAERSSAEGKLILVNLLKIMVENDGRLLGTNQSDLAVRTALVPRLENATPIIDGLPNPRYSLEETPLSVTTLRSSSLDKIEDLLLRGNRRQASQFAMDEKLWAHAMIIASSIDKDTWKDVVNDFLRSELPHREHSKPNGTGIGGSQPLNNRESLRAVYSLFSGQGPAAIQELSPVSLLHRATRGLQAPISALTPRTPSFPSSQITVPLESLSRWTETAAMMISTPMTLESSGALAALGDQLLANNWIEAAHACYLLSSQSSVGGLAVPPSKVILLGSKNPGDTLKDTDSLTFSEILEFALSLGPAVKGQEVFHGLPHLQAYRFIRAVAFAEVGDMPLAVRYCEAISASLTQNSPYNTAVFLEQLQGLTQRLTGVHSDKSGSWIGGKISKPSLDTIGGWLEGRFTKLVTGDSDPASPVSEEKKAPDHSFVGPFAHYSTISSTTPSARSSPQPPAITPILPPPQRTSSAMAIRSPYAQIPIERSSSAFDYARHHPAIQTSNSGANSIASSQSSPIKSTQDKYTPGGDAYGPRSPLIDEIETPVQGTSWWDNSSNATNKTPTAANFAPVNELLNPSGSNGFVSLISDQSFSAEPNPMPKKLDTSAADIEVEDDLGLGNSKPKPKPKFEKEGDSPDAQEREKTATPAPKQAQSASPATSGNKSWFSISRLWGGGGDATSGPIKASLGEESAFYYDKEQKRWINRKVTSEEGAKPAAPPPPPSRSQTASPGMSGGVRLPPPSPGPPLRPASAIDLSTEPPTKVPPRVRSNLAPPTESAPSTPTETGLSTSSPPPFSRPRSQATKRNIRSRYVDVFQQEGGSS